MPEHVHLLLHPDSDKYSISEIMQFIKGPFARRILAFWRKHDPHRLQGLHVMSGKRKSNRFWQAGGGFDRNLYKMERIIKAIDYIEYNPVHRGLVSEPAHWAWSSAQARMGSSDTPLKIDVLENDGGRIIEPC